MQKTSRIVFGEMIQEARSEGNICVCVYIYIFIYLSQPMDPEKKSLNFIFPTKYVIPKSLKFSHWPSKLFNYIQIYVQNCIWVPFCPDSMNQPAIWKNTTSVSSWTTWIPKSWRRLVGVLRPGLVTMDLVGLKYVDMLVAPWRVGHLSRFCCSDCDLTVFCLVTWQNLTID